MTAHALYIQYKTIIGGHNRSRNTSDGSAGNRLIQDASDVDSENRIHAFHSAVLNHNSGSLSQLLCGLEEETNLAGKLFSMRVEHLDCPEQHSRVRIMSAGMHASRMRRAKGKTRIFRNRKSIHVRAKSKNLSRFSTLHSRNNAAVLLGKCIGNTDFIQLLHNKLTSLR